MKLKFFSVLFLLAFSAIFLLINPGKVYAAGISVTGKTKVLNTNNSYLDFTNYNSNVTVDDGSGNFSGYAFQGAAGRIKLYALFTSQSQFFRLSRQNPA